MAKKVSSATPSANPIQGRTERPVMAAPVQRNTNSDLYAKAWKSSYDKELERERPVIFELIKHKKLRNGAKKYQTEVFFLAEDYIYDPQLKERRMIRYSKGESSIYVDKQSKLAKAVMVKFEKGVVVAMPHDPAFMEYMRLSNMNSSNASRITDAPAKFFEVSAVVVARKSMEEEVTILEASTLALRAPIDKVIPIAKYLNINTNASLDEIRYKLKSLAVKNPKAFINLFDNKEAMFKGTCKMAIEYGVIKLTSTEIAWETGASIMAIPLGQDPFEALVTYLKDENRFDEFKNDLENRLNAIIG